MADEEVDLTFFGTPVYIGQDCPQCECKHFCDLVCFRFKPKTYQCLRCVRYVKHRPVESLVRSYHMQQLLDRI